MNSKKKNITIGSTGANAGDVVYMTNRVYEWKPFLNKPKRPPRPKYATVEIERKKVGFLVVASKSVTMAQSDDYEGACSTYPEASRLAAKLMKEMM